jgi:hypothetical protein
MGLSVPASYVVPGLVSLAVLAVVAPAGATPNMIRLGARLNYDARLSLGIDRERGSDSTYGFSTSVGTAFGFIPNNRLVYAASVRSPTLARLRDRKSAMLTEEGSGWRAFKEM